MLINRIGFTPFIKGVSTYLHTHAYSNGTTLDLWNGLSQANPSLPFSIPSIMDPWVQQVGYPVVCIQDTSFCVSQHRFLATPQPLGEATTWPILVRIQALSFELPSQADLLQAYMKQHPEQAINTDGGMYRVCYNAQQWKTLSTSTLSLSPQARLGVLRDAFACASNGLVPVTVPLELCLSWAPKERNVVILKELVQGLSALAKLYMDCDFFAGFCTAVMMPIGSVLLDKLEDALNEWEDADEGKICVLIASCVRLLGYTQGMGEVVPSHGKDTSSQDKLISIVSSQLQVYTSMFLAYAHQGTPMPSELVHVSMTQAISQSAFSFQECISFMEDEARSQEERRNTLSAMGRLTNHTMDVLQFALDHVRSQDMAYPLTGLGSTKLGAETVWRAFKASFPVYYLRFGAGNFMWSRVVKCCVAGLGFEWVEDIKAFFADPAKVGSAQRVLDQALESKHARKERLDMHMLVIGEWLDGKVV